MTFPVHAHSTAFKSRKGKSKTFYLQSPLQPKSSFCLKKIFHYKIFIQYYIQSAKNNFIELCDLPKYIQIYLYGCFYLSFFLCYVVYYSCKNMLNSGAKRLSSYFFLVDSIILSCRFYRFSCIQWWLILKGSKGKQRRSQYIV